uniref:Uncharacterized protein n=1 Tax=Sphaerodactylus townsendi TaxID=933632 RepID=A0ACB8E6Z5_9SAUR
MRDPGEVAYTRVSGRDTHTVGTLRKDVDGERARLATFLAKSQELGSGSNCEADKQQRAYEALELWSEEVTQERNQLPSDLSDLRQQVAFLMAKREREKTALELSTAQEGVEEVDVEGELRAELRSLQGQLANLTLNHSPYPKSGGSVAAGRSASTYLRGLVSQGGPGKSFKVNFNGNPEELAFFLIQVGSYMKVHGTTIHGDPEMSMEWIRQAGDAEMRIRQVEQSEHQWSRAQRQPLQMPEKTMDNEKTWAGPSESAHARRRHLGLCLHCGEAGHLIASCPGRRIPAAASRTKGRSTREPP